jgi:hypothetical protein
VDRRIGDPSVVFRRRYGDCKDKSALLVAILRAAEISAQPALVSTTHGEVISIESLYRDRSTKDPYKAEADDLYTKIKKVSQKLWWSRNDSVIRLEGCAVSVAEQLFALVSLGKAKNPYLEPSEAVAFNEAYLGRKAAVAVKRLRGERYQTPGACSRGGAMPVVTGAEAE